MSAKGLFFILFVFLFIVSGSGYESGGDDKSENKKPPQENAAEKTEKAKEEKAAETSLPAAEPDDNFSSIRRQGLTAAYGGKWFFEKFDKNGNKIMSVFYEKDTLLEKKAYTYQGGKPVFVEITMPDKVITVRYDAEGRELERILYDEKKEELIEKTTSVYKNGLLAETSFEKDGLIKSSEFTYYPNGEKKTKEDFINGKRIAVIEYKKNKRTVRLFDSGKEISVFEENILNDKE